MLASLVALGFLLGSFKILFGASKLCEEDLCLDPRNNFHEWPFLRSFLEVWGTQAWPFGLVLEAFTSGHYSKYLWVQVGVLQGAKLQQFQLLNQDLCWLLFPPRIRMKRDLG